MLAATIAAAYRTTMARASSAAPPAVACRRTARPGSRSRTPPADVRGSSPDLSGFLVHTSMKVYPWIGRLDTAYEAACLVLPTGRAAFPRHPRLHRAADLSMCLGFAGVCATLVAQVSAWHPSAVRGALSYGSVLSGGTDLVMVRVSYRRSTAKQ